MRLSKDLKDIIFEVIKMDFVKFLEMKIVIFLSLLLFSCTNSSGAGPDDSVPDTPDPKLFIGDASTSEGNRLSFEIRLDKTWEEDVSVDYEVLGGTAEPGKDFENIAGTAVIQAGQKETFITIPTIDDDENEVQEAVIFRINNAINAEISIASAVGVIIDNDDISVDNLEGYTTSENHYGYDLEWGEEFENGLDLNAFSLDIGDGCPDLCGWGNNELQSYTDSENNVFVKDGKLVIRAQKDPINGLTSTRLITKGKKEFTFGRIDIRAKLPEGQGIWPALWMLGTNIDEVGWPNCGEIDIMELVGHEPQKVHGTAHWGPQGNNSTFISGTQSFEQKYSENFHVFTLLWQEDLLKWYMDEQLFHTITPANVTNTVYPFNDPFYLLFNLAIGGNWPGNPDDTTMFPQEMQVDYIRVFQEK